MLQPSRTKYRKQQKGRNRGLAHRGSRVSFGEYGLKAERGPPPVEPLGSIRDVARLAGRRWLSAAAGGAAAGAVAGFLGGLVLRFGPGSTAGDGVLLMLPLLGTAVGGVAAAGVGAGMAGAEAAFRARAAAGPCRGRGRPSGLAVGGTAPPPGAPRARGPVRPRSLAADRCRGGPGPRRSGRAGLRPGHADGRRRHGHPAGARPGSRRAPGGARPCALAAGMLGWSGRFLGAMSLDFTAQSFPGSEVGLAPLAPAARRAGAGRRDPGSRSAPSRA